MKRTRKPNKTIEERVKEIISDYSHHVISDATTLGMHFGYDLKIFNKFLDDLSHAFSPEIKMTVIEWFSPNWEEVRIGMVVELIEQELEK